MVAPKPKLRTGGRRSFTLVLLAVAALAAWQMAWPFLPTTLLFLESFDPSVPPWDEFRTVDCPHMLAHLAAYTNDPNNGTKHQRQTETEYPFWVSLHGEDFDKVRWDIWKYGRYYERSLEDAWAKLLHQAPKGAHVLDVGGNIGYYSLFSASHGGELVIDSFEPNLKNVLRFCESLVLNEWDPPRPGGPLVTINNIGISNQPGNLTFYEHPNPGAGGFAVSIAAYQGRQTQLPVVTLDYFARTKGWFETRPRIEILKVDVERLEPQVILGARELIQSGLVRNIFMETAVTNPEDMEQERAAVQLVVDAGYKVAGQGDFRGPGEKSPWTHDDTLIASIFDYIKKGDKITAPYVNIWWTLDESNIITR